MKTLISFILTSLLFCSLAHAQGQTYARIRDATATDTANVSAAGATYANTIIGLTTKSSIYGYDGANWDAVTVGTALAATSLSTAPPTDAYYMVSKTAAVNAANNAIFTQLSQDGTTAVGAANPLPISATMGANTLANPLFYQLSTGAAAVGIGTGADATGLRVSPTTDSYYMISKTAAANAVGNTIFVELSDGAAAFLDSTAAPGYLRFQDGDSTVLTDVIDTQADGLATTLNGLVTSSILYGYDGATFDMVRLTASGGVQVGVESWPVAYDDGNAWVNTRKKEIKTLSTPKTSASTSGDDTVILGSVELLGYPNFTIYILNADAADSTTSTSVDVSPDGSTWISLSGSDCGIMAPGDACTISTGASSYRYVRGVVSDGGGNAVDMEIWVTANLN